MNMSKKEMYIRPLADIEIFSKSQSLLVNFSAEGELGEWEEDGDL